jgi:hypothetical protein
LLSEFVPHQIDRGSLKTSSRHSMRRLLVQPDHILASEELIIFATGTAFAVAMPRVTARSLAVLGIGLAAAPLGGGWKTYNYGGSLLIRSIRPSRWRLS